MYRLSGTTKHPVVNKWGAKFLSSTNCSLCNHRFGSDWCEYCPTYTQLNEPIDPYEERPGDDEIGDFDEEQEDYA